MARRSTKARRATARRSEAVRTATGFPLRVREAQDEIRGAKGVRPRHPTINPEHLRLHCDGCGRRRQGCRSASVRINLRDPVAGPIAGVAGGGAISMLLCPGCRR